MNDLNADEEVSHDTCLVRYNLDVTCKTVLTLFQTLINYILAHPSLKGQSTKSIIFRSSIKSDYLAANAISELKLPAKL